MKWSKKGYTKWLCTNKYLFLFGQKKLRIKGGTQTSLGKTQKEKTLGNMKKVFDIFLFTRA